MTVRVLQVLHGAPPDQLGGAGLVAGVLARALQELGCAVTLAHPGADGPDTWRGVPLVAAHPRRTWGWSGSWQGDPSAVRQLLARVQPDVVHVHHLSGWSLALPELAREMGARVVVTLHDYATACARGQLVDRWGQVCAGPSVDRCSRCLAPHLGVGARVLGVPSRRSRQQVAQRLDQAARSLAAAHVRLAPSHDLARRMQQLGAGPVHVHPVPLPAAVRPAPTAPPGPVRFLFCGSLIPTKGAHVLLDAFLRVPAGRATLTIAGPDPRIWNDPTYGHRIATRAARSPQVTVVGAVPHRRIPALLAAHDVLVVPSLWPENSPLIVREATGSGLRTILPVVGGAHELDPDATLADARGPNGQNQLLAAILTQADAGRGRRPPLRWPTPGDCARSLLQHWYATDSRAGPRHTD